MMKVKKIEKKCWLEGFQAIYDGVKKFDLRIADFTCREGDILVLREWNQKNKTYTGRVMEMKITYFLKTKDLKFFKKGDIKKYGFQVLSLEKIN